MRVGGRGKTANASSRARLYQGVKTLLEPYGVRYLDTIPREIIHEIFFLTYEAKKRARVCSSGSPRNCWDARPTKEEYRAQGYIPTHGVTSYDTETTISYARMRLWVWVLDRGSTVSHANAGLQGS